MPPGSRASHIITSKISSRSQPCWHAVKRDQFLGSEARPHQRPFAFAHKDFRKERAGIVGRGLDRAVGARAHDRKQIRAFGSATERSSAMKSPDSHTAMNYGKPRLIDGA